MQVERCQVVGQTLRTLHVIKKNYHAGIITLKVQGIEYVKQTNEDGAQKR